MIAEVAGVDRVQDTFIATANDTVFGLASNFFARDLSRVYKVAKASEYGIVGVNTGIISTEVAPFGGAKQSGLAREGSRHGIADYPELNYICMSFDADGPSTAQPTKLPMIKDYFRASASL